ncbi:hypothetical protein GCM10028784_30220 [Myceligenerans cantabricum]
MPRFNSIADDAEESYQAMRATAHQTVTVDDPAELYWLLGTLNGTARLLQQVLYQAATAHRHHAGAAFTHSGDHEVGRRHATNAAREIRQAAGLLTRVQSHLDKSQTHSGTIAWHPPQTVDTDRPNTLPGPPNPDDDAAGREAPPEDRVEP